MAERARFSVLARLLVLVILVLVAGACGGKGGNDVAGPENTLKVVLAGTGHGRVLCPWGTIDCPTACGPFDWTPGAMPPLVAVPDAATSVFVGWAGSGGCTHFARSICTWCRRTPLPGSWR